MPTPLSLRRVAPDSVRNAVASMTGAPLGGLLIAAALAAPALAGGRTVGLALALLVVAAQLAAIVVGLAALTRAALGRPARPLGVRVGLDEARLAGSMALSGLFLALVLLVLGLVPMAVAGATGFGPGGDFTVVPGTSLEQAGWRIWVLLALEIATVMIVLSLFARLLPAGPATLASGHVVSLAAVKWTRGSGLKPMAGLILMLAPLVALIAWGLLGAPDATWTDWVWAAVLGGVQAPLLVGYATALFRAAAPQGYAP